MKIDKDHLYIVSPYNTAKIMQAMGGTWSKKENAWRFPKSVYVLRELANRFPKLSHTESFQDVLKKLTSGRDRLKDIKRLEPEKIEGDRLRPYQRQDVQYLKSIPCAGVFNQPRTGKTPTMIETIKAKGTKSNIIVCPASLQHNWRREISTWHTGVEVYIYTGTQTQRQEVLKKFHTDAQSIKYLIASKDIVKRDIKILTFHHDVLVVDEAHFLRNRGTLQSEAIQMLGTFSGSRYALTGTPTVKHPSDIFGILQFLYPKKFSSYWGFVKRYFEVLENGFGKEIGKPIPHRQEELKDIIDAISTQRLRKDVMQWLPEKERHTHFCQMGKKQQKIYEEMKQDFYTKVGKTELDAQNVLSQLMRLRQITLDPALLGLDIPSAKTEALLEAIEDNTYDEPLIIMSMFTSYLNMLKPMIEKLGKRVGMITGEMSNAQKDQSARDFQSGKLDVLLCNIISAGTGFTLDRGEVIIFTDKAWNPSDNEQAEDRITPTQQTNVHNHFIVSMVCESTIDERINTILDRKESLTSFINQCKNIDELNLLLL